MSQQPESTTGGVQPNVSWSSQPNHNNVPSGSPGERPQLSEAQNAAQIAAQNAAKIAAQITAQIAAQEFWTGGNHNYYRPLYIAAQRGDWKSAKSFIDNDPNALTARITVFAHTVLHVAAICSQWVFILKLLELRSPWTPESIAVQDADGYTVLHHVATGGCTKTAKILAQRNANLLHIHSIDGGLPLTTSIISESKEMVRYLSLITRVDSPTSPFFIPSLPGFLCNLIHSGYLDVALYFIRKYPDLALAKDEFGKSLFFHLAIQPSNFFSGSNLGFWRRWIYKFVPADESPVLVTSIQPCVSATQAFQRFKRLLWKAIAQLAPSIKMAQDAKLKHECAVELVNYFCTQLSSRSFQQIIQFLQNPPNDVLFQAIALGIEEIVKILLEHFPDLAYYDALPRRNILSTAIEYRQEKIVNIIKDISLTMTKKLCSCMLESKYTTLHLAGKLAPAFKLFSVSGAAFQMQREMQWFKEVEKMINSGLKESINSEGEKAKDVFRREHKELAEQGEKWMKDTANSCMLVTTLIATVLFAASFTVPGGNANDKGIPIFLRTDPFTVFAISNALGLFSSLTSLLMFLAILTARYAMDDFLESLPKRLIIGLGSLFFAIVAMIVAFGATLTIVLSERWQWVSMPITILASFPVAIFVKLQLPLFIQMVQSTYGSGMFRPWPSRIE